MSRRHSAAVRRKTIGIWLMAPLLVCGLGITGAFAWVRARSPAASPPERIVAAPGIARPAQVSVPIRISAPVPDSRFVVRHILPVTNPMRQGDFYWDETGAPAGDVVVTIDLAAQTLSIFRAGYEIGTAVIIFGAEEKPTPLGIFPITQKDAHHVSNLYDAPMPYMLRLTNDGISIHGSEVGNGYVTHGCVGIPTAFAHKLFDAVKLGDKVIVTRGKILNMGDPITAT